MADLKLSLIVSAVDRVTAPVRKITAATGRLSERLNATAAAAGVTRRRAEQLRRGLGAAGRATLALADQQERLRGRIVASTRRLLEQTGGLKRWGTAAWTAAGAIKTIAVKAGFALSGLAYGIKRTFVDTAADFEDFRATLKTIEGSSTKAQAAMDWISDFAVTTPFELGQVTASFVKLRSYGMDPTTGLLRDLGDTASAMGKPLMQAVEAIADAVTGENERLKEFGIKARAVKGGKFQYEYTADGETRIAEAMANDRAQIEQVLRGIMRGKFGGAMEERARTFRGMVSNLLDQWTRFQNMVMGSGAFDFLRDKLRSWLDAINRMAEDGSLQEIAEQVGERLVSAFKMAEAAVEWAWPWIKRLAVGLDWIARKIGGWSNMIMIASSLFVAKKVSGAAKSLGLFQQAAAPAAAAAPAGGAGPLASVMGGLFPGARAAPGAAAAAPKAGGLAGLLTRLGGFSGILKGIGAALGALTIKFWIIAAVVAAVAGLVYQYWEPIKAFLGGVWEGFKEGLQPVFAALEPLRAAAAEVFGAIGEWLQPVIAWFKELLGPVEWTGEELSGVAAVGKMVGKFLAVAFQLALAPILAIAAAASLVIDKWTALKTFFSDLVTSAGEFGSKFIKAIGDGIMSRAEGMLGPLKWVLDKAKALLPSSDARTGPLSRLTGAGGAILGTMGQGVIRAGPGALRRPLAETLRAATAGLALSLPAAGATAGGTPAAGLALPRAAPTTVDNRLHVEQLTIQQQPGEDGAALAERVLQEIERRRRLAGRGALRDEL